MRKHFLLCLLACLGISSFGWSQDRFTLNGYVKDAENGETLIGAAVYIEELQTGITTNVYGFYTITVPADDYTLTVTYIGYNELQQRVKVSTDVSVDLEMLPEASELSTVVVEANSTREQVKSTQMSVDRITTKQAKILPALFGEVDIIKTLQLKPGVSNGGEGSSGLIVRGGGPDQNLIILDEAIVYNPNHLFGFFSTFNPDAVKDVQLYKGGFPAEYGGRLSSVIDVRLKDGNRKKFAGSGGLGIISSRLTLEGPIVKDQGSFIVSGRRTYVDIF
ncbi:MAG: TonB-dependent receptor, partial [Bacteroidota bacterium]